MEKLAIVVPCYNEEEVLKIASEALRGVLDDLIHKGKIAEDSFILFVNDGSKDRTWELIEEEHQAHPVQVCGVKLAGNVGHQFALTAGLITAMDLSDVTVSIDADLQDDVAVIEEMIDKFHNGCDIVYGVRKERKTDTFFKRTTAQGFYKVMEDCLQSCGFPTDVQARGRTVLQVSGDQSVLKRYDAFDRLSDGLCIL